MPTVTVTVPGIDHTFATGTYLGEVLTQPGRLVLTESLPGNPLIAEDPELIAWYDTSALNVAASYYKFKTFEFEAGWSKYSAVKTWLGLDPDWSHSQVDDYLQTEYGMDIDTVYAMLAATYLPAGITLGDAAYVYDPPWVINFGGPIYDWINSIDYAFTLAAFADTGGPDSIYSCVYDAGGPTGTTFPSGAAVVGANTTTITGGGTVEFNTNHVTNPQDQCMFSLVTMNSPPKETVVSALSGYFGHSPTAAEITYSLIPADGPAPEDESTVGIIGTRYGLANLNHGYAINPRKARG